jgi:hypothetical protein
MVLMQHVDHNATMPFVRQYAEVMARMPLIYHRRREPSLQPDISARVFQRRWRSSRICRSRSR